MVRESLTGKAMVAAPKIQEALNEDSLSLPVLQVAPQLVGIPATGGWQGGVFGPSANDTCAELYLLSRRAVKRTNIGDDLHGWLLEQATALRERRSAELDCDNLAEELEAMAATERRELLRRLTTLCAHLLKWKYQPERQNRGWQLTITRSRTELERILEGSSGLQGSLEAFVEKGYSAARRDAGVAMGLSRQEWESRLPADCPWSLRQLIFDSDFLP